MNKLRLNINIESITWNYTVGILDKPTVILVGDGKLYFTFSGWGYAKPPSRGRNWRLPSIISIQENQYGFWRRGTYNEFY